MASTSARPKGVRPPCGGFFHAATRCSCSDRRPRISAAGSLRSPRRLPALSGWLRLSIFLLTLTDLGKPVERATNRNLIQPDLSLKFLPISPASPTFTPRSSLRSYVLLHSC